MKECRKCLATKPYEDFTVNRAVKDGRGSYCRECTRANSKAHYQKTYKRKFPKEKFIDGKRYCTICKEYKDLDNFHKSNLSWCIECKSERDRKRYDDERKYPRKIVDGKYHCRNCGEYFDEEDMKLSRSNSKYPGRTFCKTCAKATAHIRNVKSHGITEEEYFNALEEQNYSCKICGGKEMSFRNRLSIDHDHNHCSGSHGCRECFRGLLCSQCNMGLGAAKDNVEILKKMINYLETSGQQRGSQTS